MGPHRLILSAMLLLSTPAFAQQSNSNDPVFTLPRTPPPTDSRRQGPELDVFRPDTTPTPAPVAPPTLVVPTVTPNPTPPPTSRAPNPTPRTTPAETPRATRPIPTPAPSRPTPAPATTPAEPPSSPPARDAEPAAAPAPDNAVEMTTPPAAAPDPVPAPVDNGVPAATTPADAPQGLPWPWILGGLVALAAIAAALWLRRKRGQANDAVEESPVAQMPAEPAPVPAPTVAPIPADPVAPPPIAAPAPTEADRPWIDMALDISIARHSLIGVTIGYTLVLHNRGDRAALDILVRGVLGNAGAQQQQLLERFFGGETGLPLHSVVSIAPGDSVRIASELRLAQEEIAPVEMGNRALLVPLAAFDAHYRWADADDLPQGSGRTARAFIVGQEQEPPADRLAPFRMDQGPRQYRRPAARAAAELPPA